MVLVSVSCKKKGYILGGSLESTQTYAHTLTYDVLKGNPSFDTLAMLLDTAGLIDAVNQPNTTLFAPTDISIYGYLQARTIADQNVDPSAQFGLDSLIYYIRNNINGTRDSLSMYIIAQPLPFSALTAAGIVYPTGLSGDSAIVSYEYTKDGNLGYNSIVSSVPQVVYFTQLWQHYAIGPNTPADSITTQGAHTLCTTSGIQTQNGYLNTLESSSVLFFYGSKP
jgi:hypothetical protein